MRPVNRCRDFLERLDLMDASFIRVNVGFKTGPDVSFQTVSELHKCLDVVRVRPGRPELLRECVPCPALCQRAFRYVLKLVLVSDLGGVARQVDVPVGRDLDYQNGTSSWNCSPAGAL